MGITRLKTRGKEREEREEKLTRKWKDKERKGKRRKIKIACLKKKEKKG